MENNDNEVVENNVSVQENKPEDKKGVLKWAIIGLIFAILIGSVLSKVYEFGMNLLYTVVYGDDAEMYGATERITFGKEEEEENSYTVAHGKSYLLENYQVELFSYNSETKTTKSEAYEFMSSLSGDYAGGRTGWFEDYRDIKAPQYINNAMRNGYDVAMILEGQVLSIEEGGNVIMLQDNIFSDNDLYNVNSAFDALTCYVDVSMLEDTELYTGDYVTLYAYMPGKMPMQDGSYSPCIIALAVEFQ